MLVTYSPIPALRRILNIASHDASPDVLIGIAKAMQHWQDGVNQHDNGVRINLADVRNAYTSIGWAELQCLGHSDLTNYVRGTLADIASALFDNYLDPYEEYPE